MELIRTFSQIGKGDVDIAGGKGASLAKLTKAGLPVPDGFHVTTGAYRRFVADNELGPSIKRALNSVDISQPQTLECASQTIRETLQTA